MRSIIDSTVVTIRLATVFAYGVAMSSLNFVIVIYLSKHYSEIMSTSIVVLMTFLSAFTGSVLSRILFSRFDAITVRAALLVAELSLLLVILFFESFAAVVSIFLMIVVSQSELIWSRLFTLDMLRSRRSIERINKIISTGGIVIGVLAPSYGLAFYHASTDSFFVIFMMVNVVYTAIILQSRRETRDTPSQQRKLSNARNDGPSSYSQATQTGYLYVFAGVLLTGATYTLLQAYVSAIGTGGEDRFMAYKALVGGAIAAAIVWSFPSGNVTFRRYQSVLGVLLVAFLLICFRVVDSIVFMFIISNVATNLNAYMVNGLVLVEMDRNKRFVGNVFLLRSIGLPISAAAVYFFLE